MRHGVRMALLALLLCASAAGCRLLETKPPLGPPPPPTYPPGFNSYAAGG